MAFLASTQETARRETGDETSAAFVPKAERPMDFLVYALNRAVVRKQSAETKET